MLCARPMCEEKESRINGYCSVYCQDVGELQKENAALKRVRDGLLWLNNNIDHYGSDDFLGYLKAAIQDALLTAEESE